MATYVIEFLVHVPLAYTAVDKYHLGLYGIALVTAFDYFLRFLVLQGLLSLSRFQEHLVSMRDP